MSLRKLARVQPASPWGNLDGVEAIANRVSIVTGSIHAQTQAEGGGQVCVLAVALQVKYSGIFKVEVGAGFSDSTTGKVITHGLAVVPFSSQPERRFSGGAALSIAVSSDISRGLSDVPGDWGQVLTHDANGVPTAGIEFDQVAVTGNAPGGFVLYTESVPTLTGLLVTNAVGANNYKFSGIVYNGDYTNNALPAPAFQLNRLVVFGLVLLTNQGTDVVTYQNGFISAIELPPPA